MLEFQTAVEESFDVQLLAGVRFPEVIGFQKDTVHHTFIVPPEHQSPRLVPRTMSTPAEAMDAARPVSAGGAVECAAAAS